jgi:isopenicillin N synthase-like dioxygenase
MSAIEGSAGLSKTGEVPIVDISEFYTGDEAAKYRVARNFGRAFEASGFLALTGYDIDESVIDSAYNSAKTFFSLTLEEKMAYAFPERATNRGYLPVGIETVARTLQAQTPPDLCEALVYRSLFQEERQEQHPNPASAGWSNLWPARPAELKRSVTEYFWALDALATSLYRIAALALELPEHFFEPYFRDHCNTLRFVNYPDQIAEPLPGQLRYGAHHDYGGLTLVRQDAAPGGLQICAADGSWHDAPVVPRSFIINVGDLMAHWTNNRWRSTLHRVINPARGLTGSTQRLSIVLFSRPDDTAMIESLPSCVDGEHPMLIPPVSAGAFTSAKMKQSAT